jgi:radical SAM superfamily enzyme YgiQ (UPF0313 family)
MIFVNPAAQSNTDIPNVALAYAATILKAQAVVDFNTMPEPADRLYKQKIDVLGISFQSRSISEAEKIKARYKNVFPDAQVKSIAGILDVQCCYPFMQWDDRLDYGDSFSDATPFPNYELFDSFPVFLKNWQNGTWPYVIMTSRGCPYSCTYCMSHNRKWLPRSASNCAQELKHVQDAWRIKSFTILDDCFNVKKDRVIEFCQAVEPLGLAWSCTNGLRADRFDQEQAAAMQRAGCTTVGFGIE